MNSDPLTRGTDLEREKCRRACVTGALLLASLAALTNGFSLPSHVRHTRWDQEPFAPYAPAFEPRD